MRYNGKIGFSISMLNMLKEIFNDTLIYDVDIINYKISTCQSISQYIKDIYLKELSFLKDMKLKYPTLVLLNDESCDITSNITNSRTISPELLEDYLLVTHGSNFLNYLALANMTEETYPEYSSACKTIFYSLCESLNDWLNSKLMKQFNLGWFYLYKKYGGRYNIR